MRHTWPTISLLAGNSTGTGRDRLPGSGGRAGRSAAYRSSPRGAPCAAAPRPRAVRPGPRDHHRNPARLGARRPASAGRRRHLRAGGRPRAERRRRSGSAWRSSRPNPSGSSPRWPRSSNDAAAVRRSTGSRTDRSSSSATSADGAETIWSRWTGLELVAQTGRSVCAGELIGDTATGARTGLRPRLHVAIFRSLETAADRRAGPGSAVGGRRLGSRRHPIRGSSSVLPTTGDPTPTPKAAPNGAGHPRHPLRPVAALVLRPPDEPGRRPGCLVVRRVRPGATSTRSTTSPTSATPIPA